MMKYAVPLGSCKVSMCDQGIQVGQYVDLQPDGEGSQWYLHGPTATAVSCSVDGQVECMSGLCTDVHAENPIGSAQLLDARYVGSQIRASVDVLGGSAWFSSVAKMSKDA